MHLKDVPPNSLVRLYPDVAGWYGYSYALRTGTRGWFVPCPEDGPEGFYGPDTWGWAWWSSAAEGYGGDVVLSGLTDEDIAEFAACATEDEIEALICNLGTPATPATLRARAAALQAEAQDLLRRADAIEAGEAG